MTEEEMRDKFVERLEGAPIAQELKDASGQRWVKDPDGLWNGGRGIRMNALALWASCCPTKNRKSGKPKSDPKPVEVQEGLF